MKLEIWMKSFVNTMKEFDVKEVRVSIGLDSNMEVISKSPNTVTFTLSKRN